MNIILPVISALPLFFGRISSEPIVKEYHVFVPPMIDVSPITNPPGRLVGNQYHIINLRTVNNSAIRLQCVINLPDIDDCDYSSVSIFAAGKGKTYCGQTVAEVNYLSNYVVIAYKVLAHEVSGIYTGGSFACEVDARIMSKDGPVDIPKPDYNTEPLPEIDSSENGVTPGPKQPTCPCGWTNKQSGRIVGGKEYNQNEYPFIAQLLNADTKQHFCGGSIITRTHVITAAHCFYFAGGLLPIVAAGTYDNSQTILPTGAQLSMAAELIPHEMYVHNPNDASPYDIGLIRLANPFTFTEVVGPVCLPRSPLSIIGQRVRVLGWGATKLGGSSNLLPQKVDLKVIDPLTCAYEFGNIFPYNDLHQLCTYEQNKTACQGDSGGPVVWLDPETNRYTLVGAVSFAADCTGSKASVQTDISALRGWIEEKLAGSESSAICGNW